MKPILILLAFAIILTIFLMGKYCAWKILVLKSYGFDTYEDKLIDI